MSRTELHRSINWSKVRWPTALIGLVLLIFGQFQIASNIVPLSPPNPLGEWLNKTIHLAIPSIDNVLHGLPLLLLGGVLLAISLRGLRLLPAKEKEIQEHTISLRLIRSAWPLALAGTVLFGVLLLGLYGRDYQSFLPLLWLISITTFAVITAIWDRRRQVNLSPGLTRQDLLWLIGLLIAGFVIGAYRLQGMPDQLMGDEGNFWTIARDIATGNLKPPIFGTGVYSFPIMSSIFQAWTLRIFGIDLWGWRFGSVLAGVITVLPVYLLAKDAFNRKVAIASSIALITSPYFIVFSRLGYNNIQALFITALALYWMYAGLKRTSSFLIFLAGCTCGLGFYTYFAARGVLITAILFIFIMWLLRSIKRRQAMHAICMLGLGVFLVVAPHYVYGINRTAQDLSFKAFESIFFNVFNGRQFFPDAELFKYAPPIQVGGNELFYNPTIYAILIARGFIRSLLVFQKPWLVSEHYIAFPLAGTVGVIFYLIGLALSIKTLKQPRSLLLILWFFVNVVGFSTLNTVPPRHTHMVAIIPAIALLIGVGLNALVRAITFIHPLLKKYKNITLAILIACAGIGGLVDFFITMPAKYQPQPDQIMSWAGLNSHGESFIYIYSNPAEKEFRPYIMSEFRQSISFVTIPVNDFVNHKQTITGDKKTVIFYPPDLAKELVPVLQAQWGRNLVNRTFYSTNGTPVLAAGMNTHFTFERDRGFLDVLGDSFRHLCLILLLSILILLLGLVAFLPSVKMPTLPAWFKRLAEWFNGPDQAPAEEENYDYIEEYPSPPPPTISEPPEWATEYLPPNDQPSLGKIKGEFRSIGTEQGKDYYIRIHVPPIRLPWFQASQGFQLSIPAVHIPQGILLVLSTSLAIAAQIFIAGNNFLIGSLLYIASAIGLMVWGRTNIKWKGIFTGQVRISPKAEVLLVILLLILISFFHFYDLGYRVYGLEADETKWTVQSWYSTILQINRGEFATMHYKDLPLDFWVRSIFLRIFGLNFFSARIESAFLSIVAALFLYLLVKRSTASPPAAMLSTILYAFSFVELNASHQALHNTTLEVWMFSGLYFLIRGFQQRRWWQFQIAGILIALGMLTYETFFPTPIVVLIYLIGLAMYEIIKKKWAARKWLQALLLVIWPIVVVYLEFTREYLAARQGYHFGWLSKFSGNGKNILGAFHFFVTNIADLLLTLFSRVRWPDSLINWTGPFVNPFLLPFIVIGLVYTIWNLRRPHYLFILVWYLLHTLAAPIILGSVWPRVLYTGLVPLMIWGAMGLWVFLGALRTWFDGFKIKIALPVFAILVLAIILNDHHIFSSSLLDPMDRQKRRELADLTALSASRVPMILLPYEPNHNDSVDLESHVILFSVAGARHLGLDAQENFRQIEFNQLLPSLWQERQLDSLDLIFDKTAPNLQDQRSQALGVVLNCYPGASIKAAGKFFDVYHFDSEALNRPKCYQAAPPLIVSPQDGSIFPFGEPVTLAWDSQGLETTSFNLLLEQKNQGIYWIEAENSFQAPGWYKSSQFVNGYSGEGFLLDEWHAGKVEYSFDVPQDGQYRIWIRSLKRRINDQHNYITVNGKTIEFVQNGNQLDTWVWEDVGRFDLSKGKLPITLSRTYGIDEQYSVFIDALLITTDLDHPPTEIDVWKRIVSTGEISPAASSYTLPVQLLSAGEYRWNVRIFDGDRLLDFTGARGVNSQTSTFTVQP